ncbi:N-acetylglucosaminidase [Salinicoccus sp. Marseille-QA3877]
MLNKDKNDLPLLLLSIIMGVFVITFIVSETIGNRNYQSEYTFDEAVSAQLDKNTQDVTIQDGELTNADENQLREYMKTDQDHYPLQHMDLREKVEVDIDILNEILKDKGILEGRGETFLEAQNLYDINVLYLISHTQVETGNGESELAQGVETDQTYYNFFGIGAFDKQAVEAGSSYAEQEGWTSPEAAIIGGAEFISNNYVNNYQNTLYKMRWNPEKPGTHQYATDIRWSVIIADIMSSYYKDYELNTADYEYIEYKNE